MVLFYFFIFFIGTFSVFAELSDETKKIEPTKKSNVENKYSPLQFSKKAPVANFPKSEKYFKFENKKFNIDVSNSYITSEEVNENEISEESELTQRDVNGGLWINSGINYSPKDWLIISTKLNYLYYSVVEIKGNNHTNANLVGWADPKFNLAAKIYTYNLWSFWVHNNLQLDIYENSITENRDKLGFGLSTLGELEEFNIFTGMNIQRTWKKKASLSYHDIWLNFGFESVLNNFLFGLECIYGYREKRVIAGPNISTNSNIEHHFNDHVFGSFILSSHYYLNKTFAPFFTYSILQTGESDYEKKTYKDGNLISTSPTLEHTNAEMNLTIGLKVKF